MIKPTRAIGIANEHLLSESRADCHLEMVLVKATVVALFAALLFGVVIWEQCPCLTAGYVIDSGNPSCCVVVCGVRGVDLWCQKIAPKSFRKLCAPASGPGLVRTIIIANVLWSC